MAAELPQPLLTDEDWQAIADEADRIVPGRLIAVIQKRIGLALAHGVAAVPVPGSEPFERWRKELRACIVQLLYVAHESKSPAECKAHPLYSSVMHLVDGGPSLATIGVKELPAGHWRCVCGTALKGGATHMNCPAGVGACGSTECSQGCVDPMNCRRTHGVTPTWDGGCEHCQRTDAQPRPDDEWCEHCQRGIAGVTAPQGESKPQHPPMGPTRYSLDEPGTVWQDAAGTIPANVGDPVGRIDEVCGRAPPLLSDPPGRLCRDDDGRLYFEFKRGGISG